MGILNICGGALLWALSFSAFGVTVGTYTFDESELVDDVTSYSGATGLMDTGNAWVDPLTSTQLTDTNAGTFQATNITAGYNNVTLGMRLNQTTVINGDGADMALFFLFDQATPSNSLSVSANGVPLVVSSFKNVYNSGGIQQVVNNVGWDGQTLNNVLLMVAEVDLAGTGVNSFSDFAVTLGQTTAETPVALSMVGAINSAVIPVPAAVWLFGSGLLGLVGVARRKK